MEITQTTVPGAGKLHDIVTRAGRRLRILVENGGGREAYLYPHGDEGAVISLALEPDEADAIAGILHSRPVPARLRDLERRVARLEQAGAS
ncbi:MAG TPA: hypothetical protein VNR36_11155 [Pseudolysinimonas sp.]|nr:hypothetical protein [Pseudolysinimonas sp.]